MKKLLSCAVVFSLICTSIACAQGVAGLSLPGFGGLPENVTVNPSVQVGFQRVGSNISLPVGAELQAGLLQVESLEISLKDANLWAGTAGATVKAGELLSFFASVGGSLNRPFVVSGEIPVRLGPIGRQPTIEFTSSKMGSWFAQGGVGLGPILLGLYGDHFAIEVNDPRRDSVPLDNQTLRGDVITTTLAPFIGFVVPASNGLFTIMYSPLAMSNTTLVLRTSSQDLAQVQYKWNKPGNLLSCSFQYNMAPVNSVSLALWGGYTWMDVRGNAELDFRNATSDVSRQKDVTATMTKYVLQGGVTAGINF